MVLWEKPTPEMYNIFIIRSNRAGVVLGFRKPNRENVFWKKKTQIPFFPDQRSRNVYFFFPAEKYTSVKKVSAWEQSLFSDIFLTYNFLDLLSPAIFAAYFFLFLFSVVIFFQVLDS